jgi:transcriptional regulator with XRE-family HTH domain
MDFKRGGQVIQRIRKKRRLTQGQLAKMVEIEPNSISRFERGDLLPALPTLIDICNALEIGVDAVLASYISVDAPIRWEPLAKRLERMSQGKQRKIQTILDCVIETL